MNTHDAINHYHDLLTNGLAQETHEHFFALLKERGLYFGERPVCVVLRPHLYFEDEWKHFQDRMLKVASAFQRTHEVCMQSPEHRKQLMLLDYEEDLLSTETGVLPWTSSRMDTFYIQEERTFKCVEYNAETPAGLGYEEQLGEVFSQLEVVKQFEKRYKTRSMRGMKNLYESLVRAYHEWGGVGNPNIGIIDWTDVPTLFEHQICKTYFEARGCASKLADPRTLEYRDGKLWAGDFRIDLFYKRVLWAELIDTLGVNNPIIQALRDRAVLITNSIGCKLIAKKASLSFMSDERNAHFFNADQLDAIAEHIPWTRNVEERHTTYQGQDIDLPQFILDNRDKLVLKPNDEYGGKGVVIGWEASPEEWHETLVEALGERFVVQERVKVASKPYPLWVDGEMTYPNLYVDADPYIFYGESVNGCLTRLSSKALLNVTAGAGSVVPTFLISE